MIVNEILDESDRNSIFMVDMMDCIGTSTWDDIITTMVGHGTGDYLRDKTNHIFVTANVLSQSLGLTDY
jgi:hypothetical protein